MTLIIEVKVDTKLVLFFTHLTVKASNVVSCADRAIVILDICHDTGTICRVTNGHFGTHDWVPQCSFYDYDVASLDEYQLLFIDLC